MRQRNHAPRFEEIAKMKLQAFRPSNPKSLQSQTSLRSKNRLPLNGLEGVHGRLTLEVTPPNGAAYEISLHDTMPWQAPPPRQVQRFRLQCDPANPAGLHLLY